MLLNDEVVCVTIKLFKAKEGGITVVDLVNGLLEALKDLFGARTIYLDSRSERLFVVLLMIGKKFVCPSVCTFCNEIEKGFEMGLVS